MGFSRQEYWSGVPLPPPLLLEREEKNVALAAYFLHLEPLAFLSLTLSIGALKL